MIQFPRVRYCLDAPSWAATRQASVPVFLAPPTLRSAWPRLAGLAASSPATVAAARRAGCDLRSTLRFLLWLDTAQCFGIEALESSDEITSVLGRHLPEPRESSLKRAVSVTAVIIAKNEETILPAALRSLESFADELIVVDDRSTDATAEIARDMGARVLTRSLSTNFAAQRNAGLAEVRTAWAVCIDADERLEPELAPLARQLMAWPGADSVFAPVLNLITERGAAPVHWPDVKVRIFRARLRYRGAVHERLDGWRRPMFLPLSGPYFQHEKTLLSQHRSTLRYEAIDPRPYTREEIASVKEEMAQLERAQNDERD